MTTETNKIENAVIALVTKGLDFEAYSNIESRNTFIGIRSKTKKFVWDWFKAHNYYMGGTTMDFDHSYFQNSGKIRKSVMHRIRTRANYETLLGVQLSF